MLLLFRDVMRFGYNHGWALLSLILPYLLLLAVANIAVNLWAPQESLWYGLYLSVLLALYPLYMGRIIKYLAQVAGPANEAPDQLNVNAREWRMLFLVNLMITALVTVGLVVFILPGIYLAARFAFAEFIVLLRSSSPLASMAHSWQEAEPHMWPLFFGTMMIFGISTLLELPLTSLNDLSTATRVAVVLADELLSLLTTIVLIIFFYRVYCLNNAER